MIYASFGPCELPLIRQLPQTWRHQLRKTLSTTPKCEFFLQLENSQAQRKRKSERSLSAQEFSSHFWGRSNVSRSELRLHLGRRYLTDGQLVSLALKIRQLSDDEYNELVQLLKTKLIAYPVSSAKSSEPQSLFPLRVPFPHPAGLFQGCNAFYMSPCIKALPSFPLLQSIYSLATHTDGLQKNHSECTPEKQAEISKPIIHD